MPSIHYLPDEKKMDVNAEENILAASLRAGITHAHACGGQGRCSTCRVTILEGLDRCQPRTPQEIRLAERLHLSPEVRLACQTTISGDVTLRRLLLDANDVEISVGLTKSEGPVSLGEEKNIAILFADIRDFTAFSESQPPYDVIYLLNRYFHEMNRVIRKHGGYVDNYMGDGLIALFGVEEPKDAALRAIKAGLEMLQAVKKMSRFVKSVYGRSLRIGIGVHYGHVVVGSINSCDRKRMTAIGDAVNLASRLEAATKTCGASFLISEETYGAVRHQVRPGKKHAKIQLKGKSGRHTLYEIAGLLPRNKAPRKRTPARRVSTG